MMYVWLWEKIEFNFREENSQYPPLKIYITDGKCISEKIISTKQGNNVFANKTWLSSIVSFGFSRESNWGMKRWEGAALAKRSIRPARSLSIDDSAEMDPCWVCSCKTYHGEKFLCSVSSVGSTMTRINDE